MRLPTVKLEYFVKVYAERLGTYTSYSQYPHITRSMKKDNFCDITGLWISAGFPYIAFNDNGYTFAHISLFGFYRHVGAMLSMGTSTLVSQIFD